MAVHTIGLIGMGCLALLIFLRVPAGVAMGLVGMCGYAAVDGWARAFTVFGEMPFDAATNYDLAIIPMVLLMGELAARYAASTGSGRSTLGILVPTSVALILYALISEQSVSKLFAAALVPMLALAMLSAIVGLAATAIASGPTPGEALGAAKQRLRDLAASWDVVLVFGLSLVGLYAGWFSPTEAGGVGAFSAFVLSAARRSLSWPALKQSFSDAVRTTCMLFLLVMSAFIFSYFVEQTHLPALLLGWMKQWHVGAIGLVAILVMLYVVVRRFLDDSATILITVPIFLPLAVQYGYDPIWFGVMLVVAIELSPLRRPVGMNIFAIRARIPERTIRCVHRMTMPIAPVALLVILVAWPQLALWLPNLFYR